MMKHYFLLTALAAFMTVGCTPGNTEKESIPVYIPTLPEKPGTDTTDNPDDTPTDNPTDNPTPPVVSTVKINKHDIASPPEGHCFYVTVTSSGAFSVNIESPEWILPDRASLPSQHSYTILPNVTAAERSSRIIFSSTADTRDADTLTITQKPMAQVSDNSLKVLAIGNSFSVDAMSYLYPMLKQASGREVVLGNLYIGNCSLEQHLNNLNNNATWYTYYSNTSDNWTTIEPYTSRLALMQQKWDYISIQQVSGKSGLVGTFEPYLSSLIREVRKVCPDAKLLWHMTWAYQADSNHSDFPSYDRDQMKMYESIVNATKEGIIPSGEFEMVIPCGTAVQNLRTSVFGDNLTRDGYHMSYSGGRFVTAMMWAKQLTGCNLDVITYKPGYTYSAIELAAIKEAVDNAYAHPFEVTKSAYPFTPVSYEPDATIDELMASNGYDLRKYRKLDLQFTFHSYYLSTSKWALETVDTYASSFATTQRFTKEELPEGSVIVVVPDFQYRPEGWQTANAKNSSGRPDNVSALFTTVSESWHGNFNYRAFNVSRKGTPSLSEEDKVRLVSSFAIYVPKEE